MTPAACSDSPITGLLTPSPDQLQPGVSDAPTTTAITVCGDRTTRREIAMVRSAALFVGLYLLGAVATALAAIAVMNHLDGRLASW